MGEILALGVTHYPPLCGVDEDMAWILRKMLENPNLPEKYRTPSGWPEPMRKEWGEDEGSRPRRAIAPIWSAGSIRSAPRSTTSSRISC